MSEAKRVEADEAAGNPRNGDRGQSALTQLRAWLTQKALPPSTRLPPERELSELLGVSRGELRKALAILEEHGELWRHVGKGTFIGARPVAEISSVAAVAGQTSPGDVMRARLAIEPQLAHEAALHATADDIAEMQLCSRERLPRRDVAAIRELGQPAASGGRGRCP